MHSENFYDHKIRPLTHKPFFAGDVRERNEALYHNISGNDSKANSALSHNLNGEVSKIIVIRDIITTIKKGRMHSNLKMNAL